MKRFGILVVIVFDNGYDFIGANILDVSMKYNIIYKTSSNYYS